MYTIYTCREVYIVCVLGRGSMREKGVEMATHITQKHGQEM